MSDALPLPPRPDIDHYRELAKELRRARISDSRPKVGRVHVD